MAATNGRRTASSGTRGRSSGSRQTQAARKKEEALRAEQDQKLFHEIGLIVLFAAMVFLFFCNFGIIGPAGNAVSGFLFGLFGLLAYAVPVLLFLATAFWFANGGNPNALRKLISGIVLFLAAGIFCDMVTNISASLNGYSAKVLYESCRDARSGGGILAGSLSYLLRHYLGTLGAVLVLILTAAVSFILLTGKSLISGVANGGSRMREISREEARRRREYVLERREEQEKQRALREEERRRKTEEKENEKILRMEKKVSGVMLDTALPRQGGNTRRDDVHEIMFTGTEEEGQSLGASQEPALDFEKIRIRSMHQVTVQEEETDQEDAYEETFPQEMAGEDALPCEEEPLEEAFGEPFAEPSPEPPAWKAPSHPEAGLSGAGDAIRIHKEGDGEQLRPKAVQESGVKPERKFPKKYLFPPISKLQKGVGAVGDSTAELKETALRLQQTLHTFGVRVTITDISQGPSVTRYELQPEQGVKVSKIVGLADDIKLNLAATDIRIEAPIPGKAAIGIEVPNKENMPVALRDLLESKEFKEFPSNLAFAVGKDIAGKVVVADIAKMPHMLIAGATGSGKSVCINTLIMSILYKAHPDDVKLIMIDPKVVELSVYNGIPHLLIPVVTDPKKASAALHWGVSEMEDRYRKFADWNVRDLKGYNKKAESMGESGGETVSKLPQIVIIVDELADLMMVSPGEVEESICRLAQLARAAGIHLIIATQRPSVDVITGLIKANMPSRVAFSVSSGVDSRTILDMNGAEKLLGKGDMLFYPQGYSKPARIQGAFVSDKEVSDVVDFLKNQTLGNVYAEDIEEKIKNLGSGAAGGPGGGSDSALDELFEKAGRFIIDKDKASIGMLQRVLKVGFNRAARIMDQLSEYGVVGEEEGTKPRKVLMGMEQFEQLLEEIL